MALENEVAQALPSPCKPYSVLDLQPSDRNWCRAWQLAFGLTAGKM